MKIRIEGCTQEDFDSHGRDLVVGKDYKVKESDGNIRHIIDEVGFEIVCLLSDRFKCAHLPKGARWVEVSE